MCHTNSKFQQQQFNLHYEERVGLNIQELGSSFCCEEKLIKSHIRLLYPTDCIEKEKNKCLKTKILSLDIVRNHFKNMNRIVREPLSFKGRIYIGYFIHHFLIRMLSSFKNDYSSNQKEEEKIYMDNIVLILPSF